MIFNHKDVFCSKSTSHPHSKSPRQHFPSVELALSIVRYLPSCSCLADSALQHLHPLFDFPKRFWRFCVWGNATLAVSSSLTDFCNCCGSQLLAKLFPPVMQWAEAAFIAFSRGQQAIGGRLLPLHRALNISHSYPAHSSRQFVPTVCPSV
jgi:hypothetical protein